jgi:hypothetical protein
MNVPLLSFIARIGIIAAEAVRGRWDATKV